MLVSGPLIGLIGLDCKHVDGVDHQMSGMVCMEVRVGHIIEVLKVECDPIP